MRSSLSLDGLDQFSSGTGAIFISSYELNFPGTSTAGAAGIELSSATEGVNWRYLSGVNVNTGRAAGPIEFAEDGATNGWGSVSGDPAFEQEINYVAGTFGNGMTSTIDFLNGDNGYNGFTVASLLGNGVNNTDANLPMLSPGSGFDRRAAASPPAATETGGSLPSTTWPAAVWTCWP